MNDEGHRHNCQAFMLFTCPPQIFLILPIYFCEINLVFFVWEICCNVGLEGFALSLDSVNGCFIFNHFFLFLATLLFVIQKPSSELFNHFPDGETEETKRGEAS